MYLLHRLIAHIWQQPLGQTLLLDFKPSHFAVSPDVSVALIIVVFFSLIARPNGNGSLIVTEFLSVFCRFFSRCSRSVLEITVGYRTLSDQNAVNVPLILQYVRTLYVPALD